MVMKWWWRSTAHLASALPTPPAVWAQRSIGSKPNGAVLLKQSGWRRRSRLPVEPKLLAVVHAETSTGVYQPVEQLGGLAHRYGALMVMDAVTSLGCVPVEIDHWQIDVCYSCTQKGIGAPPGLAPVTFNERAMQVVRTRKQKCRSWYFDVSMIERYWGPDRLYHHTAPISMNYAIYEALRIVVEEGLEARFKRHLANSARIASGAPGDGTRTGRTTGYRLPQLTAVRVPGGIDEAKVRAELLRTLQLGNRRRARRLQGQGLAHRPDGRVVAARERDAGAQRIRDSAGRARNGNRAWGCASSSRQQLQWRALNFADKSSATGGEAASKTSFEDSI